MSQFGKGFAQPTMQIGEKRKLSSVLAGFLKLTKNAPSPFLFRKWAAISMIGGCLTRRAWTWTEQGIIYPNSMTLFVGAASVGKGPSIDPVEKLLRRVDTTFDVLRQFEGIHVGPADATTAGLFDEFISEEAQKTFELNGETTNFQAVILIAEELSAMMHSVDAQMMGYMIKLLNCQTHSQRLRGKGETLVIERPVLHILGGVQPKMLSQLFPAQFFGMGLTARTTFVYSNEPKRVSPFTKNETDIHLEDDIVHDLTKITRLVGRFKLHSAAVDIIENWWLFEAENDMQKHPKLEGYNGKRILHLFRLCMVHSAARADHMVVEASDVENALKDLLEVEAVMPNIFEEMSGEFSSVDVFQDLTHQIKKEFLRTKEPIPMHILTRFVALKVKSYEIPTIIEALIAQKYIKVVENKVKVPGASGPKSVIPGEELGM